MQRGAELDEKLRKMANNVSPEVSDLVALTTRSVMASMEVTCASGSDDVLVFVDSMASRHESPNSIRYSSHTCDIPYSPVVTATPTVSMTFMLHGLQL